MLGCTISKYLYILYHSKEQYFFFIQEAANATIGILSSLQSVMNLLCQFFCFKTKKRHKTTKGKHSNVSLCFHVFCCHSSPPYMLLPVTHTHLLAFKTLSTVKGNTSADRFTRRTSDHHLPSSKCAGKNRITVTHISMTHDSTHRKTPNWTVLIFSAHSDALT